MVQSISLPLNCKITHCRLYYIRQMKYLRSIRLWTRLQIKYHINTLRGGFLGDKLLLRGSDGQCNPSTAISMAKSCFNRLEIYSWYNVILSSGKRALSWIYFPDGPLCKGTRINISRQKPRKLYLLQEKIILFIEAIGIVLLPELPGYIT